MMKIQINFDYDTDSESLLSYEYHVMNQHL